MPARDPAPYERVERCGGVGIASISSSPEAWRRPTLRVAAGDPTSRPRALPYCRSWRIVTEPLPPLHAGRIASLGNRESFARHAVCVRPALPNSLGVSALNPQPGSSVMKSPRWMLGAATMLSLALVLSPTRLSAQGVTTGAVSGTVTDAAGKPVENAQVQITNRSTGYRSGAMTRASDYDTV